MKPKKLILRCNCAAAKVSKACGYLEIIDAQDGDMEIEGIFLKKAAVAKLIKFLQGK